jgi:hypothetical protein
MANQTKLLFLLGSVLIAFSFAYDANVCTGSELSFEADLSSQGTQWNHFWEECVGSGHALLGLRQGNSFSDLYRFTNYRLEKAIRILSRKIRVRRKASDM